MTFPGHSDAFDHVSQGSLPSRSGQPLAGGLVLPINCAWYLIVTRKPRATRGFSKVL